MLLSFRFGAEPIQGSWQCTSKSGKFDAMTEFHFLCGGDVTFRADHLTESTCTDAFIPNGTIWQMADNNLVLKDSKGQAFMQFEVRQLDETSLALVRKDVVYTFRRTAPASTDLLSGE